MAKKYPRRDALRGVPSARPSPALRGVPFCLCRKEPKTHSGGAGRFDFGSKRRSLAHRPRAPRDPPFTGAIGRTWHSKRLPRLTHWTHFRPRPSQGLGFSKLHRGRLSSQRLRGRRIRPVLRAVFTRRPPPEHSLWVLSLIGEKVPPRRNIPGGAMLSRSDWTHYGAASLRLGANPAGTARLGFAPRSGPSAPMGLSSRF